MLYSCTNMATVGIKGLNGADRLETFMSPNWRHRSRRWRHRSGSEPAYNSFARRGHVGRGRRTRQTTALLRRHGRTCSFHLQRPDSGTLTATQSNESIELSSRRQVSCQGAIVCYFVCNNICMVHVHYLPYVTRTLTSLNMKIKYM